MKGYEEKLKQLETALIDHKPLVVDLGDECRYRLTWDEKINNYRGKSLLSGVELGKWEIETLLSMYKQVEVEHGYDTNDQRRSV